MKKNIFELKDFKLKSLTLLVTLFLWVGGIKAQDLVVTLTNGNTESFAVSNILSIKFDGEEMRLYELTGTTNIWDINNIDNYAFDGVANIEESMNVSANNLNVFPNPSSDNLTINYTSNFSGKITISVTDVNGKHVEDIYFGEHNTETEIFWKAKEKNPSGKYLIKITTENKVITKPVIIQ